MTKEGLEKFLYYMLDKVDDCCKKEVELAVKEFLKENSLGDEFITINYSAVKEYCNETKGSPESKLIESIINIFRIK